MKKVILLGLTALTILSCSPEDVLDCNCGLIVSDRVSDYSIVIRNACSGNERRFTLAPGDWMNAFVGTNFCITNTTRW